MQPHFYEDPLESAFHVAYLILIALVLGRFQKFCSTIDFTTRPFTSASQILICVLRTRRSVRIMTYLNSLLLYPGTATLSRRLILAKNWASTFPWVFYNKWSKMHVILLYGYSWHPFGTFFSTALCPPGLSPRGGAPRSLHR